MAALNFPSAPTNGQKWTDPNGQAWTYETTTNSWTAEGAPVPGMVYKGGIDVTVAPPTGALGGWVYTVTKGGTPNAGFTGLTGTVAAQTQIIFDGTNWQTQSPPGVWSRTGTVVSPTNAGDAIQLSATGTAPASGAGIYSPGADTLGFTTGGVEKLRLDSAPGLIYAGNGNRNAAPVDTTIAATGAIGTSLAGASLTIQGGRSTGSGSGGPVIIATASPGANGTSLNPATERARVSATGVVTIGDGTTNAVSLDPGSTGSPLVRDSQGRLLVGTSSSSSNNLLVVQGSAGSAAGLLAVARNNNTPGLFDALALLNFTTSLHETVAQIQAARDGGTWTASSSYPTALTFSTTADGASSPTERMRINSDGRILFGTTVATSTSNSGITLVPSTNGRMLLDCGTTSTATAQLQRFFNGNGQVGSISTNGSATAFNASSDYRLKENIVAVTDGITRLQQLKPSRFNFIADPGTIVDGFIAHEVQAVVPEAITGEKDAVDDEGNPEYQGIDQSKLVPLLTAALQEAIGEIESLKARVAVLESA